MTRTRFLSSRKCAASGAGSVRHLGRDVGGDVELVAVLARDDEDRVALDGRDGQPRVLDPHPHDPVRAGERVLRVSGSRSPATTLCPEPVELQRCAGRQRLLHVDDRGQRVVVDVDQLDRVDGLGAGLRDDQRDRLADEPNPVDGQRRRAGTGR